MLTGRRSSGSGRPSRPPRGGATSHFQARPGSTWGRRHSRGRRSPGALPPRPATTSSSHTTSSWQSPRPCHANLTCHRTTQGPQAGQRDSGKRPPERAPPGQRRGGEAAAVQVGAKDPARLTAHRRSRLHHSGPGNPTGPKGLGSDRSTGRERRPRRAEPARQTLERARFYRNRENGCGFVMAARL